MRPSIGERSCDTYAIRPLREIIALLLKRLGYRMQEASSGEDGLRLAQGSQEKINLLITDILMPGMSGRELARPSWLAIRA
jgi:CheY-like chemotaxis protein